MAQNDIEQTGITSELVDSLWQGAESLREGMVEFTRRLIQKQSLPGRESEVAAILAAEMRSLGYDDVQLDEAGNVIGHIRATAEPPAGRQKRRVMLNTHMDHVDVGDPTAWPHPPYEAVVENGEIWGRGASDLKGALACHVYAGALLKRLNLPLVNDVYVVGVVQEEVGGLGSSVLADNLPVDYVVLGEPSENRLALGHRGRIEIVVTITGKSVHASVPQTGINPLYSMSRFLVALEGLRFEAHPDHAELGPTSIAPTLFSTDQASANVVPGECRVVLDVRNSPADTPDAILARVQVLLDASLMDGATAKAVVPPFTLTSYTGVTRTLSGHGAYSIPADGPVATAARSIISAAVRREVPTQMWRFATDAGYFVAKGCGIIGFGPGFEDVIHTVDERISIQLMVEGMVASAALALELS
ncbi:MAG TPA: M20/M25/M40 family metallo-hydrolase [Chloroflexia bacterium]|nr:M20/M25/M40 family metallo-hydrolase [Chloroflexia bacterium]